MLRREGLREREVLLPLSCVLADNPEYSGRGRGQRYLSFRLGHSLRRCVGGGRQQRQKRQKLYAVFKNATFLQIFLFYGHNNAFLLYVLFEVLIVVVVLLTVFVVVSRAPEIIDLYYVLSE